MVCFLACTIGWAYSTNSSIRTGHAPVCVCVCVCVCVVGSLLVKFQYSRTLYSGHIGYIVQCPVYRDVSSVN